MNDDRRECTFIWLIENYSYCWLENGESLVSPDFTAYGLQGTFWSLIDVELKTETKTFPAHKVWLCAISFVFKTMLSSDMREKNSNIIPIDDLENDTVQQLLQFIYTDRLEDLCWDSATKLYYAGDKYQIERLKVICSSFLVNNVSPSSASELLILADKHSDSDLKEAVEDFILRHEEQVFELEEWHKLTETNSQLALKTMLLKYKKKMTDA
ncbi:unnamed protein product [Larinioides sclopetarius]|uniref:BTB domain-containing protein n=1 Tax=Larinioides sclopetarius TaxID=280406 RepID=A0AAV2A5Z3_9ARAC